MNTVHLCAESEPAEEQTPLGDFSGWSDADWCTLYCRMIKCVLHHI